MTILQKFPNTNPLRNPREPADPLCGASLQYSASFCIGFRSCKTTSFHFSIFLHFSGFGSRDSLGQDFKGFERPRLVQIEIWKEIGRNLKDFRRFSIVPEAARASALLIFLAFACFSLNLQCSAQVTPEPPYPRFPFNSDEKIMKDARMV